MGAGATTGEAAGANTGAGSAGATALTIGGQQRGKLANRPFQMRAVEALELVKVLAEVAQGLATPVQAHMQGLAIPVQVQTQGLVDRVLVLRVAVEQVLVLRVAVEQVLVSGFAATEPGLVMQEQQLPLEVLLRVSTSPRSGSCKTEHTEQSVSI
ncbi:unnamed protein product, partial [Iphiclides podalirius]